MRFRSTCSICRCKWDLQTVDFLISHLQHLATVYGHNPYFDQWKLCSHLIDSLEKEPTMFPLIKVQKRRKKILRELVLPVKCMCSLPDNGSHMVQNSACQKWFHVGCIVSGKPCLDGDWHCVYRISSYFWLYVLSFL